jgi:hypothetical protein
MSGIEIKPLTSKKMCYLFIETERTRVRTHQMLIRARKTSTLEITTPVQKGYYQTENLRAEVTKRDFKSRRASEKSLL